MEFGWINLFGAGFVLLLLIPNIIYAIKNRDEKNLCANRLMNALEQTGRYACIVLMWLPLLVWKFGFGSETALLLYLAGNGALLLAYWLVFALYFRRKTAARALVLAVLPVCVFLLSGVLLRHWLLAGFAALFAVGHLYVTKKNAAACADGKNAEAPSLSFGYNRFADLFYYLLAHLPIDCAADVSDPDFVKEMAARLGAAPDLPDGLAAYYQAHFDRLAIVNFIPLIAEDAEAFKKATAACAGLTDEDRAAFLGPLTAACDRTGAAFAKWWEERHEAAGADADAVYAAFGALKDRFGCLYAEPALRKTRVVFSYTLRKNGRACRNAGAEVVYLPFPETEEEIVPCFLQFLHECTHPVTDPLLRRRIRMSDGSHALSEWQALCFDEYLIRALCPELAEAYRDRFGAGTLAQAHECLGDRGERRIKKRLARILGNTTGGMK